MLNEHDRRELDLIEEKLRSDDRRFTDIFRAGRPGARRDRRWMRCALVAFGAFLLLVGLVAGAAGLFFQGLLILSAGVGWILLRRRTAASEDRSAAAAQPGHPSGGDASPPEWHRPI